MTDPLSNLPQGVWRFIEGLDFAMLQHSDDALVGVGNIRVGDYRKFRAELVRVTNELAALRARIADAPVYEMPSSKPTTEAGWAQVIESIRNERSLRGKRVRLVLDKGVQK